MMNTEKTEDRRGLQLARTNHHARDGTDLHHARDGTDLHHARDGTDLHHARDGTDLHHARDGTDLHHARDGTDLHHARDGTDLHHARDGTDLHHARDGTDLHHARDGTDLPRSLKGGAGIKDKTKKPLNMEEKMKTFKLITLGALAAMLFPASAMAYQALANSTITNTASITWTGGSATSNTATITVDELIDVTETIDNSPITNVLNSAGNALRFTITNTGNGRETFKLSTSFTSSGTFTLADAKVYIDTNRNGTYDAGTDAEQYSTGVLGNTSSIQAFIVSTYGASGTNGETVTAYLEVTTATTGFGSYAAGQVSAGQGDGSTDAIIGTTNGQILNVAGVYQLAATALAIFKSYSAYDPWGTNLAVPTGYITYHLRVTGSGGGYAANTVLTDNVPAFTNYSGNSIRVNGVPQSDGVDGDYGSYTPTTVTISFGNFSSTWTRDIYFSTIVQ